MASEQEEDAEMHAVFASLRAMAHGTVDGFRARVLARVDEQEDWQAASTPSWWDILTAGIWEATGMASKVVHSVEEEKP